MGLGALMFFLAGLKLHGASGRAGAHALAQLVAEDLRAARQEAMAKRRPVALCFPSGGGSKGHATACYVLEGEAAPRITRVREYGREFPQAQVFLGTWTSGTNRNLNLPGNKYAGFKPDDWLPTDRKADYCFIFMPDGSVRTNDLPSFDGAYHLAVTAGVQYASGNAPSGVATMSPGPSYYELSKAGDSYTLALSGNGAVSMSNGLTGGSAPAAGLLASTPGAAPPALPEPVTSAPDILGKPRIYPPQDPTLLPPDTEAVVTKDQFLSLEVVARSPTGDQLFCKWEVEANPANSQPGTGVYSMQNFGGGGRMEWDPNFDAGPGEPKGAWRAVWQWRPPPTALPLDKYELACQVTNYDGGKVDAEVQRIEIIPPGRILFESERDGNPQRIFSMNEDGSQQRGYKDGSEPSATLNGSRIVFVRGGNLWLAFPNDPSKEIQLTTDGNKRIPAISPNGNWIAYRDTALGKIMVMKTQAGATPVELSDGGPPTLHRPGDPSATEKIAWNRAGTKVAFNKVNNIYVREVKAGLGGNPDPQDFPSGPFVWAGEGGQDGDAVISPSFSVANDEDMYVINNYRSSDYDPYLFRVNNLGVHVWNNVTQYFEEAMVERDPGGSSVVLEEWQPVASMGTPQIGKVDTSGGTGPPFRFLTSNGRNTRPVWTR